jgi:EPS-associated MarR family transcriptional regulator
MSEQIPKEYSLSLIKAIERDPEATQRILAKAMGVSLGKTNYILKELIERGLIKVKHFSTHRGKLRKIRYILTKEGIERKIFLIQHFMAIKEAEFNTLKKEWKDLVAKKNLATNAGSQK